MGKEARVRMGKMKQGDDIDIDKNRCASRYKVAGGRSNLISSSSIPILGEERTDQSTF